MERAAHTQSLGAKRPAWTRPVRRWSIASAAGLGLPSSLHQEPAARCVSAACAPSRRLPSLGQVLIAKDDAYILDSRGRAGPPAWPSSRCRRAGGARDAAECLIRSIDYSTTARRLRQRRRRLAARGARGRCRRSSRSGGRRPPRSSWNACRHPTPMPPCGPPTPREAQDLLDFFLLERRSTKWNTS